MPHTNGRTVSVFGGSAPTAETPAYQAAWRMGRLLGEAGWRVATGGYEGTMEAVSRGAAEAGAQVVGVVCEVFERAGLQPNPWVGEVVRLGTLRERLYYLVRECHAALALSGGIGTLSEVAFTWSLLQAGEIPPKPLVLVGPQWDRSLLAFLESHAGMVRPKDLELLTLCPTAEDAVQELARRIGPPSISHTL